MDNAGSGIRNRVRSRLAKGLWSLATHLSGYKRLEEGEIRLAYFSRSGDQLHCELKHVCISDRPEYHALSYVWGWTPDTDNSASKPVFVNGKRAYVTANLGDFIDQITQLQSPAPPIWADAVCINQNDIAEKNAQVRRMGDIYKDASHIDIWLGKHEESSRTCIENMERWHKLVTQLEERYPDVEELYGASQAWLYEIGVLDSESRLLVDREAWMQFARFVERRKYWQRIWTVQEYCMPKADRTFICGDTTFTHQCIYDAVFLAKLIMMHGDAKDAEFLSRPMDLVMATENLRRKYALPPPEVPTTYEQFNGVVFDRPPISMHHIMSSLRSRLATDPRDKVFALLGFLEEPLRADPLLTIDYSLSTSEVFTMTAAYMLKMSRSLDFLGLVHPPNPSSPLCPSWVLDWSDSRVGVLNLPGVIHNVPGVTPIGSWFFRVFSPTRPTYSPWPSEYPAPLLQPLPPIVPSATKASFELHVQGIYLDMIVSLVGDPPKEDLPGVPTISRWLDELCDSPHLDYPIVDSRPAYPHRPKRDVYPSPHDPQAPGEPMLLAALRTLAFDVDFDRDTQHHTRPPKGLEQLASMSVEDAARGFIEGVEGAAADSEPDYAEKSRLQIRRNLLRGRRPALTQRGHICMVPAHAEVEDCILALAGGCMVYVVRHTGFVPERYTFVGEAYMHGWMDDGIAEDAGRKVTFVLA